MGGRRWRAAGRRATSSSMEGGRWYLALAAAQSLAWRRGAAGPDCCAGGGPLLTKFAQVDHVPTPADEGLLSMPYGQRAVEIFNPGCDAVNLADYEIVVVDPFAVESGKDALTHVSLNPRDHAGGRGHGMAWNVPTYLEAGETFVLCTYPILDEAIVSLMETAPVAESSSLPADFARSAFVNCTVASTELTRSTGAGESSILLVRTADDSIVDALTGIPRVDRAATQQECSVVALRMEQYRHGNPAYNPVEWSWLWGKECEGHAETVSGPDFQDMERLPGGLCGQGADDPTFVTPDDLMCWDWRFYDCAKAHIECVDQHGIGCSYSDEEQTDLLVSCPWTCGLCVMFGAESVPDAVDVAAAEAQNVGVIAPDGACCNRTREDTVSATGSKFTTAPVPPPPGDFPCCPRAYPTITMFAQLGVEPYPQRALEVFNPSCAKVTLTEYELVFVGTDGPGGTNGTMTVVPLNDVRPFRGSTLTKGGSLVMCSDFSHNMVTGEDVWLLENPFGDTRVNGAYGFMVQSIAEEGVMPADLVGSTWDQCTGNMSLPRGGLAAVALRKLTDDMGMPLPSPAIVDFLPLGAPALAALPGSTEKACSIAWSRKPPSAVPLKYGELAPTTNSPTFNGTQWSAPIVGQGCTDVDADPGGWLYDDLSEVELKFGERQSLRGWGSNGQCTDPTAPLPGTEMYNLLSAEHNGVEETCCTYSHPMITKVLQLDVSFADSATGRYQQRAIEIYNPTCQTIRLADYDLLFLDDDKRIVGEVPLVSEQTLSAGGLSAERTLASQQTHVVCASTDSIDPDMENVQDRMRVSGTGHLPPLLVQTADSSCAANPMAPDGTTAWLLLPGLAGTLALRRAPNPKSPDTVIFDVLEGVPEMNSMSDKALSCNMAWVRDQRVRSSTHVFNASDWIQMVGYGCEEPASQLQTHFLDWYPASFGHRDWLEDVAVDKCMERNTGILASVFGVTMATPPSLPPDAGDADNSTNPCGNGGPLQNGAGKPCRPPVGEKTLLEVLRGVLFLLGCTCMCSLCVVCFWIWQRKKRKGGYAEGRMDIEMSLNVGGMHTSLNLGGDIDDTGLFNSPLSDSPSDFTLTVGAGALREQISRDILATRGGANVTPWGGAFIMDDMDVSDTFEGKVVVGKGSFGTVYRASFRSHMVAVKEISIDFAPSNARQNDSAQVALREFKQELQVWCKLMHPNVVQFYGYTTTPVVCIIQEFVQGGTLYELLSGSDPMSTDVRISFALDVAKGMAYLHGLLPPIIHRDLKSLNLLVAAQAGGGLPSIKLTDFGLARSKQTMMGETAKMTQVGTPYWTAPEIFDDAKYNESADVYSFAMVLYEIWSRKLPWHGLQPVQVALKVVNERARPEVPAEMNTGESFGVSALMFKCWGHEPSSRPSFVRCVSELEELIAHRIEQQSGEDPNPLLDESNEPLPGSGATNFSSGRLSTVSEVTNSAVVDFNTPEQPRFSSANSNSSRLSMTRSWTSSMSSTGGVGVPLSIEVTGRGGAPYALVMPIDLVEAPPREGVAGLTRLLEGQLGLEIVEMMYWDGDFNDLCLLEDLRPMSVAAASAQATGVLTPVQMQITHQTTPGPRGFAF